LRNSAALRAGGTAEGVRRHMGLALVAAQV